MIGFRTLLRRLTAAGGLLLAVVVLPAGLVLATQAAPWPDDLVPPPLNTGLYGDFVWNDFQNWLIATYHDIRLQLPVEYVVILGGLLVLWGLWAALICCVVADAIDLIRYGAHRLRAENPRGVRGWITALVTSTVLIGTAGPSVASALPADPVAASAPRHPGAPQHTTDPLRGGPGTDHPDPDPPPIGSTVFVHRGDSLWTLATEHLDDGNRWREITDLNPRLSPEPQFLRAGQWLHMPRDAVRLNPPPIPEGARWVTVARGDTLAGLAAQHLGDAARWSEIFDLNRGRTQPEHRTLRTPDILFPGWTLAIPPADSTTETPAPPATGRAIATPAPAPPRAPSPGPAPANPASDPRREPGSAPQPPGRVVEEVVLGLATTGALTAAAYRWRRRRTPRAPAEPLPTVYSLPVALHRTRAKPDPPTETPDDEPYPAPRIETPRTTVSADRAPENPSGIGDGTEPLRVRSVPAPGQDNDHAAAPAGLPSTTPVSPESASAAPQPDTKPGGALTLEQATTGPARAEPMIEQPEPTPEAAPVRLAVFGPVQLSLPTGDGAVEVGLQPRMRSLLAFLALHPHGTSRDEILETLWGERVTGTSALNTTVSRLRRTLAGHRPELGDLVAPDDGRYRLDPELATVDYWNFTAALKTRRHAATNDARAAADEHTIAVYHGEFAAGLDAPWAEPARAHAHRAFLDAITARTGALQDTDPHRVLGMLEAARDLAPHHEPLYRNIMRLQAHLGLHDTIPTTLALLQQRLAELATTPDQHTRALAEKLVHRQRT